MRSIEERLKKMAGGSLPKTTLYTPGAKRSIEERVVGMYQDGLRIANDEPKPGGAMTYASVLQDEPNIAKAFREADAQNLRDNLLAQSFNQYIAEQELKRQFAAPMLLPGKEQADAWTPTYEEALLQLLENTDVEAGRYTLPGLEAVNPVYMPSDMLPPRPESLLREAGNAGKIRETDLPFPGLDELLPDGVNTGKMEIADPELFEGWLKLQEEPENGEAAESLLDKIKDYQERTARQLLLGNYTDDVTLLGTLNQISLGLLNLDLPMDIRDLIYDLTHLDTTPWWQTALDLVAFFPFVGSLKYADEFGALAKGAAKNADEAGAAVKGMAKGAGKADDIIDGAAKGAGDVAKNLKPQNLMDELAQSGVKYNPDDVVMVTKTPKGKLLWLENGNSSSGLQHIVDGHVDDFANRGINDIPAFISRTLQETPVKAGINKAGPYAEYLIDGRKYRVAYGTNGYIVSFYPLKY